MDINNARVTTVADPKDVVTKKSLGNGMGKDAFFKILSAQLQYQDPLSGGDNTEYVAQLAQFSSLEQMETMNDNLQATIQRQDIMYANQLMGSEVIFTQGDEVFRGKVEAFSIVKNEPYIVVGDKEFKLDQIKAILSKNEDVIDTPVDNTPTDNTEVIEPESVETTL